MIKMNLIDDSRYSRFDVHIEPYKTVCSELGLELVVHDVATLNRLTAKAFGQDDIVYRIGTSRRARTYEYSTLSPECTSLYHDWRMGCMGRGASYFIHEKVGVPVIPTCADLPRSEEEMASCIEKLGGFPMVVKARGGSLGMGVIRVDSKEALASLVDYLRPQTGKFFVRKFIVHDHYVRAIVIGNEVVAAHAAFAMEGEFRTNAGDDTDQKREVFVPDEVLAKQIVHAVQSLGIDFGGVDILFDADGTPYIAEVNFPLNFAVTEKVTGVPIAQKLVAFLKGKHETKQRG